MTYEVSVLYFQNEVGVPRHWSIFIKQIGSATGTKHDALSHQTGNLMRPRMTWKYGAINNYDALQSGSADDLILLDTVNDVEGLIQIMRSKSALPGGPSENCQTWVYNVIAEAVRVGLIDESAINTLATVPQTGAGMSN